MINNKYVYETNLNFNISYIISSLSVINQGHLPHQWFVDKDPYFMELKEKFKILSPMCNIYDLIPFKEIPSHVDAKRKAALNIPLIGGECSFTKFYSVESSISIYDNQKNLYWISGNLTELFKFTLKKPTLINNHEIHSVKNGPSRRLILSWSVNDDYSFNDAREFFKQFK